MVILVEFYDVHAYIVANPIILLVKKKAKKTAQGKKPITHTHTTNIFSCPLRKIFKFLRVFWCCRKVPGPPLSL